MDRRNLLEVLGAGAVGLVATSGRVARGQHPHHHDKLHGEWGQIGSSVLS